MERRSTLRGKESPIPSSMIEATLLAARLARLAALTAQLLAKGTSEMLPVARPSPSPDPFELEMRLRSTRMRTLLVPSTGTLGHFGS